MLLSLRTKQKHYISNCWFTSFACLLLGFLLHVTRYMFHVTVVALLSKCAHILTWNTTHSMSAALGDEGSEGGEVNRDQTRRKTPGKNKGQWNTNGRKTAFVCLCLCVSSPCRSTYNPSAQLSFSCISRVHGWQSVTKHLSRGAEPDRVCVYVCVSVYLNGSSCMRELVHVWLYAWRCVTGVTVHLI